MAAMDATHPDADLIEALGGAAEVARRLGFNPADGGVQRVQNWKRRGIPKLLRYQRPDVFGPPEGTPPSAGKAA